MAVPEKFTKPYDHAATEDAIYKMWEESGFFNPDVCVEKGATAQNAEPFCIIMPPPNANGSLHAGHALFVTLQDIMVRFARMRGKRTLWLPGADHAGFETQVVYERVLEKEGRSRFTTPPEQLYKEILDFTLGNKKFMEGQLRALGASCDWGRELFTLDGSVVKTVYETFKKLHDDGLLYRGSRIVNWCPKHQTSLSNLETERETRTSPFYYLKYGPFTIGTVRPETKFGDKYVVMHPDDTRYAQYKEGDTLELEWINGPIVATVIKDAASDPAVGSGVMTITPWHSGVDFEIAQRHNLAGEQIIDWHGKLLPVAGEFAGMTIKDARAKIVEKMQAKGLVEKIDETYQNEVPVCYKCGREIEPQVRPQWFINMQPLAKRAIEAVQDGRVTFVTEQHEKIFMHWLENTQDWNISRQIVWGIPIPAWSKGDDWKIQEESPGEGWVRDPDTFDTWFSSGQWPMIALGFPDSDDFKTFYPTSVMETGADILFFWVARMLMLGLYRTGEVPFKKVYLHGLVRDAKGQKMSKSRGNVISPLDVSSEYGTDALRMGLVVGNTPGTDLNLDPHKINAYKKFANKLWNIARFVLAQEQVGDLQQELKDEFDALAADVTKDIEHYRIYMAAEKLYHYVWSRFASEILEESKDKPEYAATLYYILRNSLKLLHPFMPFVTEEIWQSLPGTNQLLLVEPWPKK